MDYDDELNDEEERDYKRSLQIKKPIIAEKKELPQRSTRGLRMNALVGKAIEEDDLFYQGLFGNEGGAAEESDQDFDSKDESCESAKDSFDSDFGQSSEESQGKTDF